MLDQQTKKQIANILKNGGVIAFPTDTVWGLGCLADNEEAVKKIYKLKGRDFNKPLILMSSKIENLTPYIKKLTSYLKELITKYFPGRLTIVTEKSELTKCFITSGHNTVGIRVPDNELFAEITNTEILATTSANISDFPAALTKDEVISYFGDKIDFVVDDYGYKPLGKESTVIIVEENNYKILRQGSLILN